MSNTQMYEKSLGINVNIIMGGLMLVFGLIMLFLSRKKKKAI
jgi:LPXTG-motif cell wall-anchored protein